MKLKQKNSHKRDERLFFDEEPHIYYLDGKPLDMSVTAFIHSFFSHFNPDLILNKYFDKWQKNKNHKYYGMSKEQIKELWIKIGKEESHKGTLMHKDIELFYNYFKINNLTKEFNHFLKFFNDHKEIVPYRTEWEIFDDSLMLAGSIDFIGIDKNNNFIMLDWKRSKDIKVSNNWQKGKYPLNLLDDCNFIHYSLQLNIYRAMLKANYDIDIKNMFLVRLHPNTETYEKISVPIMEEEIKQMFLIRLNKINKNVTL